MRSRNALTALIDKAIEATQIPRATRFITRRLVRRRLFFWAAFIESFAFLAVLVIADWGALREAMRTHASMAWAVFGSKTILFLMLYGDALWGRYAKHRDRDGEKD